MAKRGPNQRKRAPKLLFTENRGIGWHVSFRDPSTGSPTRHRFGLVKREDEAVARIEYHKWLGQYLEHGAPKAAGRKVAPLPPPAEVVTVPTEAVQGSLLVVASDLLSSLQARVRTDDGPRRRGSIARPVFSDRRRHVRDFLEFLNSTHGSGAVASMQLRDLTMADVEGFNQWAAQQGYSDSQVSKRMQMVKAIIDRAGRPEHGGQVLAWNWDSRESFHGRATEARTLPTKAQLEAVLAGCSARERAMVWMAIGLGFGQRDLSAVRVGQIDQQDYDLRRGKTGIERYGETPPYVWACISRYLDEVHRPVGELLFATKRGQPLVHGRSDSVTQWWTKLRERLGVDAKTLGGFYVLRHLGATELGSRPGCSLGQIRRWLGHGASSNMADVYMRPVAPEHREVVEWVRRTLASAGPDS